MTPSEAVRRCLRGARTSRSRTTSDFEMLRPRDSASISAISGSGNRTVRVFIVLLYYIPGMYERQRQAASNVLLSRLECLLSRCGSFGSAHFPVLTDFVVSTWIVDHLQVAPYLSVVGLRDHPNAEAIRAAFEALELPLILVFVFGRARVFHIARSPLRLAPNL